MNKYDLAKAEEEAFIQERKEDCVKNGFTFLPGIEMAYRYAFSCGFCHGYDIACVQSEENAINSVRAALHLSDWVREKGPQ